MEISFENKNLRQLCENQNRAKTQLGEILASRLKVLLADLDVMNNVNELMLGRIYKLELNKSNGFTIDLGEGLKVDFSVNHLDIPLLANRTVDWSKVTRIKILSIEGNNEK